ncbi:MATE family efflux transporter [Anaeroselena agilis]|uniref:MATE family efflux transporter n=1 Tax=Anaeroselena agilis TaxID=3063788 RepID=A0ABU3P3K3_9FIRM|nr:MATE family efflux transporter [Selenomonadales bacterium 4137-cl]
MREQIDLGAGNVSAVIIRFAVPLMVSLFFQNLYAYIDTVFVSWLGAEALAAVSLSVPLTYLALSLAKGASFGSVVLISYARGQGDEEGGRAVGMALLPMMTLLMAIFAPLLSADLCRAFYAFLGATDAVAAVGIGFTAWLVAGFPVMGYVFTAEALFMARGDTKTPMKGQILGNMLNFALDPLFMFVFGWGVTGAAVATFTGQLVAAVYLRRRLAIQQGERLTLALPAGVTGLWRRIVGQGVFITVAYMVSPVGLMLLNMVLARFGPLAVGAWNLMSRTEMMVMLPIMGLSNALAAFVSFNLGRGDYGRIRAGLVFFFKFSLAIVVPTMVLFTVFPRELTAVFRPAPDLVELGSAALSASAVAVLFMPALFAMNGLAQGFRRPVFMLAIGFVYIIAARVPLAYLFAARWGERGVFWSHPAAAFLAGALALALSLRLLADCRRGLAAAAAENGRGAAADG